MSQPDTPDPLFEEFPPVETEEWKLAVQEDLGINDPDEFLRRSLREGVTMPAYLQSEALDDLSHVDPDAAVPPLADASEVPANQWSICQFIAHPEPETANEHARAALDGGVDALKLILASSTANFGVVLQSAEDLATVLDGIDLNGTGLHFGRGLAGPVLYGVFREYLSARDTDPELVDGSVCYDPVAVFASGFAASEERAFALADQLVTDAEAVPNLRSVTVDASVYHEAGASAVQELAFTLGALAERLARASKADRFFPELLDELQVVASVSTSYLVEIAKLRALRLLVPQVVDPFLSAAGVDRAFAASDVQIQVETSRRSETLYDPHTNMLRGTTEAMAAVLGGCDHLAVRPYDAALRSPDVFGTRIARNVQLILRHEAHFEQVTDPAAGSYYLETLTDTLARRAWAQFQALEGDGGIIEALRAGSVQRRIEETRRERTAAIDERERVFVGTTHYPALDEQRRSDLVSGEAPSSTNPEPLSLSTHPSIDSLRTLAEDGAAPVRVLSELRGGDPSVSPLPQIRLAAEIEALRLRTEEYAEAHDGPPRVLLVPVGPSSARSARATFARNLLGVAGFEVEERLKFDSILAAADVATETNADIVVLCSSNAEYTELAPVLAAALEDRGHDALLLIAGSPDDIDAAGVADLFIHQGTRLTETLETLQVHLGMSLKSET